ncbi:hypothetical protein DSCA_05840 [Desulfosarcina alkanivorans]|uniref:Methyltransferase domain-containing protein n=1 Tax=Desulfosarcina alkanivorans TaxID=571177 RepID=A0A5K7YJX2_9BACT|nr:class I SAM-dependent methyltransferase [Desulfosarcina alkanivorans]BBO66654.1 hypothetical protein DSCA_05840 [Desulfosarcina alkanivorans]
MTNGGKPAPKRPPRQGKFTEGLLDNARILDALGIRAGQTILDAGCGNGYMAKRFWHAVSPSGKVIALDPDESLISILKKETQGTQIDAITGDITRPTRIDSSSIDLVYLSTVVHVFSKRQMGGFITEVERLLKPDGVLAVVNIEKKATPFGPPLASRLSPEALKKIIPLSAGDTITVGRHFYMQIFHNGTPNGKR